MKKQTVKSIASFVVVLIVLSIIPYGALASQKETSADQANATDENGFGKMVPGGMRHWRAGPDGMHGMVFGPAKNITEENFAEFQAEMLASITDKITELQSMHSNVSKASTAEELQAVLLAERQANAGGAEFGGRNEFPGAVCGPRFFEARDVTEKNFTDVQTEMLNSLQNMTNGLEEMQSRLTDAGEEERAEELGEKIAELQNLYTEVIEASTAAGLKEIMFSYLQTQAVTSLEKEIEFLNSRIAEDENTNDKQLEKRVAELTALIADIQGAEFLDELKEIMSSEIKFGKGPMQHGRHGNIPERTDNLQNNGSEA